MDRVAVFVDAGYLFAAAGELLTGGRTKRSELTIDVDAREELLRTFAESTCGMPLLRIYWYDGTSAGPTQDHLRLMRTQNIKVRLGIVNTFGEQKGVDSLVVSDMINLSRSGNVAAAILLTGDEDLRVGVQQAQSAGLRVHLVGVHPTRANQSNLLQQEADVTHTWAEDELGRFLTVRNKADVVAVDVTAGASRDDVIEAVVVAVVEGIDSATREALRNDVSAGAQQVPRDYDRLMLLSLSERLDEVTETEKHAMRRRFRELI